MERFMRPPWRRSTHDEAVRALWTAALALNERPGLRAIEG